MAKETITELWETIEWLNQRHECSLKTKTASLADGLSPELREQLKRLPKIPAIKELRKLTGMDLKTALSVINML